MPRVPEFDSDEDRYEWEVQQRYRAMDNLDRWFASDGVYTIGPPLPPGATVFSDEKATPAFEKATKEGFIACRPAAEVLGVSRAVVRLLIDRLPEIRVAYVVYPGKKMNSRYHCRAIHKSSVSIVKKNLSTWMQKVWAGGKKTTGKNIRRSC